jgi:hypothetical protein
MGENKGLGMYVVLMTVETLCCLVCLDGMVHIDGLVGAVANQCVESCYSTSIAKMRYMYTGTNFESRCVQTSRQTDTEDKEEARNDAGVIQLNLPTIGRLCINPFWTEAGMILNGSDHVQTTASGEEE